MPFSVPCFSFSRVSQYHIITLSFLAISAASEGNWRQCIPKDDGVLRERMKWWSFSSTKHAFITWETVVIRPKIQSGIKSIWPQGIRPTINGNFLSIDTQKSMKSHRCERWNAFNRLWSGSFWRFRFTYLH